MPKLVQDWAPLTLSFIPPRLPHREKEVKRIADFATRPAAEMNPGALVVDGLTGTGKTAVVRWVLGRLGIPTAYVSGEGRSAYAALVELAAQIAGTPRTGGRGAAELVTALAASIRGSHGFVVIDEVDRIKESPRGYRLEYLLASLLRMEGLSTVLVTNKLTWEEENIPVDLKPFVLGRVRFKPYTASQLFDILKERAEMALTPGSWDDSVLQLIAARAAQEGGSAKEAVSLLYSACQLADPHGRLEEEHVMRALELKEVSRVEEILSELPLHAKLTMQALLSLGGSALSSDLYRRYVRLAREAWRIEPLSRPSFGQILSDLERNWLIELKETRRRGRPYLVRMTVDRDVVTRVLEL